MMNFKVLQTLNATMSDGAANGGNTFDSLG